MDTKKLEYKILKRENISENLFKIFYDFLKQSFRKDEYRSFNAQKALLDKDIYEILFCFYEGEVIGIMAFWHLTEFEFIEHFAIKAEYRDNGIGGKMIEYIKDKFQNTVILEVELPYNEINRKRIYFYEQHGFSFNDFEYFQTPLNKGDEPLPLRIMSYPNPIDEKHFNKILDKLKTSVYKF